METTTLFGKKIDLKTLELSKVLAVTVVEFVAQKTEFINKKDSERFVKDLFDVILIANDLYLLIKKEEV